MAQTTFVIYKDADGSIVSAYRGDDGTPPTPGAGESVLDAGGVEVPSLRTHKVDLGPPAALIAKTQDEIDEFDGMDAESQRQTLRKQIAILEQAKLQYAIELWATTDIDAEIAELRAAHDALP